MRLSDEVLVVGYVVGVTYVATRTTVYCYRQAPPSVVLRLACNRSQGLGVRGFSKELYLSSDATDLDLSSLLPSVTQIGGVRPRPSRPSSAVAFPSSSSSPPLSRLSSPLRRPPPAQLLQDSTPDRRPVAIRRLAHLPGRGGSDCTPFEHAW